LGTDRQPVVRDYLAYSTYTYSDALSQVQFGNTFTPTIRPSAVDQGIHWEKTGAYNVGLDFGFNNQRFSGTLDWYTKNTSDMIFFIPIAAGTNLGNFITTNIGNMKNTGLELALNADLLPRNRGGLSWTAMFTAAHNTNRLLSINPNKSVTRVLTGNISGGVGNLVQELEPGVPILSFWVYQQKYGANGKPIYSDTLLNMYVDRPTVRDTVACPAAPGCVACTEGTASSTTPTAGRSTTPRRSGFWATRPISATDISTRASHCEPTWVDGFTTTWRPLKVLIRT